MILFVFDDERFLVSKKRGFEILSLKNLGFKVGNLLFDSVIDFDEILELRFVFVLILKSGVIFKEGLKVFEVVNGEGGAIFL